MTSAGNAPVDAGTKYNLPEEIRNIANLRSEVIAWTTFDEEQIQGSKCGFIFFSMAAPLLVMPCFWPHLICLSPCLGMWAVSAANALDSTYWILTETELRVVAKDYDTCCIPGLARSGNISKAIPLENITDVTVDQKGSGSCNKAAGDLTVVKVDTASSGIRKSEASGMALKHAEWFVRQVLDRRDLVKGVGPTANTMIRPDSSNDATSRINKITELRDQGLITTEEYEKKRQEILSSI